MLQGIRRRAASSGDAPGGLILPAVPSSKFPQIHPGWFVLAAGMLGVFMTTPGQTVGVSVFIDYIGTDLGIPRAQVLLLYSLGTLLGILPAPYIGRLVDRYGPRNAIGLVVLALGAACAVVAWAHGPWSLGVAFTLLRGTAIGGLSLVSGHMINLWFDRFRGRANAVSMMGLAVGGLVVPGLAEQLALAYGWRDAYLVLGAAVVVIMLPLSLLLFRNRPQAYGLLPDFGKATSKAALEIQGQTLGQARRTLIFWYLLAIGILLNAVGTALLLDHVRALQVAGVVRAAAIALLGVVTVTQVICVLGGGVLVDRYGTRNVGMLGLILLALTVTCVMTMPGLLAGAAYAAALGAGLGVLHVVQGAGLAEHFGTRHLGNLRGVASVVGIFGAAAGPLPFAAWPPQVGYVIFLVAIAAAMALGAAAVPRPFVQAEGLRP
jgi:MFS family permease